MNTIDAKEIMGELRKRMTYEQIASRVGVCFNTAYSWGRGYKKCSLANYAMLKQILEEANEANKV